MTLISKWIYISSGGSKITTLEFVHVEFTMLSMYCFGMKIVVSTQLLIKKQKAPIKKMLNFFHHLWYQYQMLMIKQMIKNHVHNPSLTLFPCCTIIQQIKYLVLQTVLSKYDLSLPMQDLLENILLVKVIKCQYWWIHSELQIIWKAASFVSMEVMAKKMILGICSFRLKSADFGWYRKVVVNWCFSTSACFKRVLLS